MAVMDMGKEILVLVGSPNKDGRSAKLARGLAEELREIGLRVCLYPLAEYPVAACTGCNMCTRSGECVIAGDGFGVLSRHMDSCAAAVIVAPVYFAGPSGWLKAALDRCQVYWARRYMLGQDVPEYRAAHLVVIGEGGDPFGYEPLVTICKSALNSTGLRVTEDTVHDFVGDNYSLDRITELRDAILKGI